MFVGRSEYRILLCCIGDSSTLLLVLLLRLSRIKKVYDYCRKIFRIGVKISFFFTASLVADCTRNIEVVGIITGIYRCVCRSVISRLAIFLRGRRKTMTIAGRSMGAPSHECKCTVSRDEASAFKSFLRSNETCFITQHSA